MSGPKTSRHTLTPEQRRQLEEHLKKIREEQIQKEKISAAKKILNDTIQRLSQAMSEMRAIPELGKDEDVSLAITVAKEKIEEAGLYLNSENTKSIYVMVDSIEESVGKLQLCLNNYALKQKEIKLEKSETLDNLIAKGFSVEFKKMPDPDKLKRNIYYEKIQIALSKLIGMHMSRGALEQLQKIKSKAQEIDSTDFLENYYTVTVFPFVQECEKYDREYTENFDHFIEILSTYKALLQECKQPNRLQVDEFSVELMSYLEEKVRQLQARILEEEEEAYISKCIDEAMDEMGYRRVGHREVTKKSGKHFRHELYKFAEGTAVDVTYSDDGQVIMELGAVDNQDRAPSEEECRSLTEDMELFCNSYSKLEDALRQKGVVRRNLSMLPVSTEYAQVINKTDYQIENDMDGYAQSCRGQAIRGAGQKESIAKHIGE